MAFDIVLRDNGAGTFDITFETAAPSEKTFTFLGLIPSEIDNSVESVCVFVE